MYDVDVEELDGVILLHIYGNLETGSLKIFEEIWKKISEKDIEIIGVNCKNLEQIDSSTISAFVKLSNRALGKQIKLVFYDLSFPMKELFKTANLDKFFTVTTKASFDSLYLLPS